MKTVTISIATIIGGGICVSASDGQIVYARITDAVAKGHRVAISFASITRMTTAFLNAAVGQLYGEFSEEQVRKSLAPPIDIEDWQLQRLKLVTDRAKQFFRNEHLVTKVFEEDSET